MNKSRLIRWPGRAALAAALSIATTAGAATIVIPFNPANFPNVPSITNPYWPLQPGSVFIYKAETPDGCEVDVFEVTNETKTVAGVVTRVIRDTAYEGEDCDGDLEIAEDTVDWYAQDNAGNIWYFGEETYDCPFATCELGEGSWEAGVDDAIAGIVMLASPKSGDRYRQEFSEGNAQDWGMIMNLGRQVRLQRDDAYPPGEWTNCLVIKEWNELEPGGVEQKTYCRNVGLVRVDEHHGPRVVFELTQDVAANPLIFRQVPAGR